jgi:lactoylglutathione lyase
MNPCTAYCLSLVQLSYASKNRREGFEMIRGIYETHLQVSQLERSVKFYESLGLVADQIVQRRRIAFFVFNKYSDHETMLGLWEIKAGEAVNKRHIAFHVTLDNLLKARDWLAEKGIPSKPVFGRDGSEPIVHANDPAAAIYFDDPDGNELELYARLPGQLPSPKAGEKDDCLLFSQARRTRLAVEGAAKFAGGAERFCSPDRSGSAPGRTGAAAASVFSELRFDPVLALHPLFTNGGNNQQKIGPASSSRI